jgi:AcrR family transcriptional regulator
MAARPREALTGRQSELFDRLVGLFLQEGFRHLTLDDLTTRLRCSKTTLYALADSREQLIRAAVVHFFRRATERIEARMQDVVGPHERLAAYLTVVAAELQPASSAFYEDVAAFGPAREVYERNTNLAAERVQHLIAEGARSRAFRPVDSTFVAAVATSAMVAIQRRQIAAATGLADAQAYRELAELLLHGLSSSAPAKSGAPGRRRRVAHRPPG